LETTLDRDLRDLTDALKLDQMPRLLRLLAAQTSGLVNYKSLADKLQLHPTTVKSYVGLLEALFLVQLVPAWRAGFGAREVRVPKATLVDTGMLLHLLGANEHRLANDDQVTGPALENFVANELRKQAEWADLPVGVFHYRDGRDEVDIVLEDHAGRLVAVEVKASASLKAKQWASLAKLRDVTGDRFQTGVVLYAGERTLPLGDRLWALPFSGLWQR
jgi:predicted AAA+ superfamily ATPase